jgi:hypothetical protein
MMCIATLQLQGQGVSGLLGNIDFMEPLLLLRERNNRVLGRTSSSIHVAATAIAR